MAWLRLPQRHPLVMGILNVTPDSFSDGGRYGNIDAAVTHAMEMAAAQADIIDIGGESTRPNATRIDAIEQIRRIVPVLNALQGRLEITISVDTTSAAVVASAVDAGALIINDISAGQEDPGMFSLAARRQLPMILMHMQGQPATMQHNPTYHDVVQEVSDFLRQRLQAAQDAGVDPCNLMLDPGIGFGKTTDHNLILLRHLPELRRLGHPLVLGPSRKRFIERISGETAISGRPWGTAASVAWCAANGADIMRVHDVEPMVKVVRTICAIGRNQNSL